MKKIARAAAPIAVLFLSLILVYGCGGSGSGTATPPRLRLDVTAPVTRGSVTEALTTISGTVSEPSAKVIINDTPVTVTSEGAFTVEFPLVYGSNRFTIRAENEGFTAASRTLTVTRALTMEITSPQDKLAVSENRVNVSGTVSDPEATVRVLGIDVPVQPDGTFSYGLNLYYPVTIISVESSVGGRDPVTRTLTVNYQSS